MLGRVNRHLVANAASGHVKLRQFVPRATGVYKYIRDVWRPSMNAVLDGR